MFSVGSQARTWELVVLQEAGRGGDMLGPLLGLEACWIAMSHPNPNPPTLPASPPGGDNPAAPGLGFCHLVSPLSFWFIFINSSISLFLYSPLQVEEVGSVEYKGEMKRGQHLHSKCCVLWSSEVLFIYQIGHFAIVRTFSYLCSGWGCQQLDALSLQAPASCVFWARHRSCCRYSFATDSVLSSPFFIFIFCKFLMNK